jgi:thiamine pyrophosphate-dependent acetolactate synthase large subunit-like protein
VVTIGQVLAMAAHLDNKGVTVLDMAGLAQKGGSVWSHVRIADSQEKLHAVRIAAGDANLVLRALADHTGPRVDHAGWVAELRDAEEAGRAADAVLLAADSAPIKPSRIYGELAKRLERDAVVICDGGDFASWD